MGWFPKGEAPQPDPNTLAGALFCYRSATMTVIKATLVAIFTVQGLLAAPIALADTVNWDAIAACESGQNWHINTGNGYSGGLQWAPGTWAANKPAGAPASAAAASREQEIAAANRLFAKAGTSPWPVCGAHG